MDMATPTRGSFSFLEAFALPLKPRTRGITIASDRGISHESTRSLIEVAADVLDYIKTPDHYALMARYPENWLRTKIALYKEAKISPTLGGVIYEVAVVQNKVEEFMERAAALGYAGIEVSEDVIDPQPASVRASHIRHAKSLGLHVFTELGRKFPDKPFDPNEGVEIAHRDLESGAAMIVVENSDIIRIVKEGSDSLHVLSERIPSGKLIFEAGPNERRPLLKWLIKEFGPSVNIENIEVQDAATVAAMRGGLHRNIGFSYFDRARDRAT
jgi:phosphosulfolactate synthase